MVSRCPVVCWGGSVNWVVPFLGAFQEEFPGLTVSGKDIPRRP
jgi:hypothetical protein